MDAPEFTWDLQPGIHVPYADEYFRSGYSWGSIAHFNKSLGVWCQSSCHLSESVVMDTFPLALGGLESIKYKYGITEPLSLREAAILTPGKLEAMGGEISSGIGKLETVVSYFSWKEFESRRHLGSPYKWFFGEQLSSEIWNISPIDEDKWILSNPHEQCTTIQLLARLRELKNQELMTSCLGGCIDEKRGRVTFLSYSSKDKDSARRIARALKNAGIKVWMDELEIGIGDSISQSLERGIEKADYLIALLSENSVNSKWVQEELRLALNLQISSSSIKVLPVMLGACTIPGFLRDRLYLDLRDEQDFDRGLAKLAQQILTT